MELKEWLERYSSGKDVNTPEARVMLDRLTQEALRITAKLNNVYHSKEEVRAIMEELTGRPFDQSCGISPPFYTDCGKNIRIGKNVFINYGCSFQDMGGITIGDNSLIGHNVTLVTINHGISPEIRQNHYPKSIRIGNNVWIGANTTILPGVTVGNNAIVGAGSVVTKDVEPNTIVAGVPASIIRRIRKQKSRQKIEPP